MTKIEELKAAYEVAQKYNDQEVVVDAYPDDGIDPVHVENAWIGFHALAHNLMPTLLKAASLVLECEPLVREYPYIHQDCRKVLEELR